MASIEIFKNESFGEVRVAGTSEKPEFCLLDVCKVLDLDSSQVMKRLDDGVVSIHPIIDNLGRERQANFVNEDGLYDVILDSRKPQAKAFRKWITSEVLPSIRKTGKYEIHPEEPKNKELSAKMSVADWAAKFLNLNATSKLMLAKPILNEVGLPVPDYVDSKGILKSATELLKARNCGLSAQGFNLRAIEKGILREIERNTSKGKKKLFKCITEKGLTYGENQVNPNNPKETQPLWYESKFDELLAVLDIKVGRAAV